MILFSPHMFIFALLYIYSDRPCGLVVRVSGYRSKFSEKQRVWNGVHSASRGQLRGYLKGKVAAPVKKTETYGWRDPLR
jgi:hypothetical protein